MLINSAVVCVPVWFFLLCLHWIFGSQQFSPVLHSPLFSQDQSQHRATTHNNTVNYTLSITCIQFDKIFIFINTALFSSQFWFNKRCLIFYDSINSSPDRFIIMCLFWYVSDSSHKKVGNEVNVDLVNFPARRHLCSIFRWSFKGSAL